jgi:F-type H+-transporting ATPase subunit a
MRLSPDELVLWEWGPLHLNATMVSTWVIMALLTLFAASVTRRLSTGPSLGWRQNLLEVTVGLIRDQIREIVQDDPDPYVPFVGTLFLYVALSNALTILPWYEAPTGSLSTTTALALSVFVAVPVFGIARQGVRGYLRQYTQPSIFMLPFNVIGELSRTLALAVRLFGNVMSGTFILAILAGLAPLFFPIVMRALGLLTGLIQAYIFAVLATVYIASATQAHSERAPRGPSAGGSHD